MKTSALLTALFVLLVAAPRADAQQISLTIQNGLVTLDAQNVPVRQILAEWARVGGVRIVNGEKVMGAPVTLQLNGVAERQALDTILRGVSGYMLASRQGGHAGQSAFDRILIMPTSSAPRGNPVPANAGFQLPRPMPVPVQAQPAPPELASEPAEVVAEDEDNEEPQEGDPEVAGEVEVQPEPAVNQRFQRGPGFPGPQGQPFTPQQVFPGVQPAETEGAETPAEQQPGPFNVPPGASSTPGVIAPVPQQDQNQQQLPRPRRPPL